MRVPTYEQTQRAPRSTGTPLSTALVPRQDPAAQGTQDFAGALGRVSDQAKNRMLQRKQELDALAVSDALSKVYKGENDRILPLYQLRGNQAVGDPNDDKTSVHGQADTIYREIISNATEGLTDAQRVQFDLRAEGIRTAGLRSAATHVAKEHQAAKLQSYQGEVDGFVNRVAAGMYLDSAALEAGIDGLKQRTDELYPGFDTSEQKASIERAVLAAYIQQMMSTDPVGAEMALEHYRERLGENYPKIEAKVKAEALYQKAKKSGDYDARQDWIESQTSYSREVRDAARRLIQADQIESEAREADRKKKSREAQLGAFYKAMVDKNMSGAARVIETWGPGDMTYQDRFQAEQILLRPPTLRSNPIAERSLWVDIKTSKITTLAELMQDPRAAELGTEDLRQLENDLTASANDPNEARQRTLLAGAFASLDPLYKAVMGTGTRGNTLRADFDKELIEEVETRRINSGGKILTRPEIIEIGQKLLKERERPWARNPREFEARAGVGRGEGMTPLAQKTPVTEEVMPVPGDTLKARVMAMPAARRAVIVKALQDANEKPYYSRIWELFEQRWPDEAERVVGGY